jgi:hypothetical protein
MIEIYKFGRLRILAANLGLMTPEFIRRFGESRSAVDGDPALNSTV